MRVSASRSELLGAGKGRRANEARLGLLGAASRFRGHDFSDAVINHFDYERAGRVGLEHDIGWLDVPMHDTTRFRRSQCPRGLLNHFECQRERHWPIAADPRFERFAFDQLHDIETLTVLFTVVSDTRDIGVTDLRGHPRFAQEARACPGILRDSSVDYFKRDGGIQHCVARAISYRHCASAELNRKAVRADFHFKVIVLQRSGCQSSAGLGFVWLLAVA